MSLVQPIIDRESAWRRLHRRRFARLRILFRSFLRLIFPRERDTAHMELLWLPHYHVSLQPDLPDGGTGVSPVKGPIEAGILVDGYDRRATRCDLSGVARRPPTGQETFEPEVTEAEAAEIARRTLLESGLRRSPWAHGLTTPSALSVQLIHYPYWVLYHECHRRRLRVAMLDAVTGKPTGPGAKVALLAALARANENPSRSDADA